MKWTAVLPPVAALAAGLSWIGREHMVLHQLQDDQDLLRKCIASAHQAEAGSADDRDRTGGLVDSAKKAKQKIDWKKVLEGQVSGPGGPDNMRLMMELQQRFMAMSEDEILAEIDEIEKLDTSDAGKRQLEAMLVQVLSEKNPALVMEKFENWLSKDPQSWQLNFAFGKWLKKDPAAATQWFDRKIEEGIFDSKALDGKSQVRLQFETSLLSDLMSRDPAAAKARLMEMPEDQRGDLFQNLAYRIKPGTEVAVAETVRSTLPPDQIPTAMANLTNGMGNENFDRVEQFMASISATREEKDAIVKKSFGSRIWSPEGGIAEEKLDQAYDWAMKQSPDNAGRLVGEALGQAVVIGGFDDASRVALKYAESGNNDEVLEGLLENARGRVSQDKALSVADKIKDPVKREEVRRKLTGETN